MVTQDGEVIFWGKLKEVMLQTKEYFLAIHKSFLVNCDYVRQYSYTNILMEDGAVLNISKANRGKVRSQLLERMEGKE